MLHHRWDQQNRAIMFDEDELVMFFGITAALGQAVKNYTTGCSLCGERSIVNKLDELKSNVAEFSGGDAEFKNVDCVCADCFEKRKICRCEVTGKVILQRDNVVDQFLSTPMRDNLYPYHRYCSVSRFLSKEGLRQIEKEHAGVQDCLRNWAGGSKRDRLPGYMVEAIVEIKTFERNKSIEDVEYDLKWHAAQVGGNAYLNFYWDRHREEQQDRYLAGHGPRGNPYYRTRRWTDVWYSGRAVAVRAVPLPAQPREKQQKARSRPPEPRREEEPEVRFRRVLGLAEVFTREELRKAYKDRMKMYHPDRVSDLGEELQQLAEEKTKEINAAFSYFKARVR